MQLFFNLASGAITTDPLTLQPLGVNTPVIAFQGDGPTLLLTFHYNGTIIVPSGPLIRFVVKKLGDFEGPAFVLCESYTPPSGAGTAFTLFPNLSASGAGSLFEYLLPNPVVDRPSNQTARFALTGLTLGQVVQQVDTGAYWQVSDPANLGNTGGWTSDVTLSQDQVLAAQFVVLQAPNFAKQTSLAFWLQINAPYYQGDESAPAGGTQFGQAIQLNFASVFNLTGGTAGCLDAVPTAGAAVLPGAAATLDLQGGPYIYKFRQLAITSTSVANPTVVTTATPHFLTTGSIVLISGDNSTPSLNGLQTVTVTSPTTFTIAMNVTGAGSDGNVTPAPTGGIAIASSSVANPTVITTGTAHGLTTGQTVTLVGDDSTPSLNGSHVVTVTGAETFTVPVDVTSAGSTGWVVPATASGAQYILPVDYAPTANPVFWQSKI